MVEQQEWGSDYVADVHGRIVQLEVSTVWGYELEYLCMDTD